MLYSSVILGVAISLPQNLIEGERKKEREREREREKKMQAGASISGVCERMSETTEGEGSRVEFS